MFYQMLLIYQVLCCVLEMYSQLRQDIYLQVIYQLNTQWIKILWREGRREDHSGYSGATDRKQVNQTDNQRSLSRSSNV